MAPPLTNFGRRNIKYYPETGKSDDSVLEHADISRRQVQRMRKNWKKYGEVTAHQPAAGRP